MKLKNGLNARQQRFAIEYPKDMNATQAAIRAGYSPKSARQKGWKLLHQMQVSKLVDKTIDKHMQRLELEADNVIKELGSLAFSNMRDYINAEAISGGPFVDFSSLTREQTAAIQEVTVDTYMEGKGEEAKEVKRVKFKLADKRGPLTDIGKFVHRWTEKHDVSIDNLENLTDEQLRQLESRILQRVTSAGSA